jgi:hypothetical protein
VFCTRSVPRCYNPDEFGSLTVGEFPCGGGVEYFHRSAASRRGDEKGGLKSETVKCGRESHGTRTPE